MLSRTLSSIYGVKVPLIIYLYSKDLFSPLSTQRNSVNKRVQPEINVIRHEYESEGVDELIRVPSRTNLAEPRTRPDYPLTEPLELILFGDCLSIDQTDLGAKTV